jgi:hypothetical protein
MVDKANAIPSLHGTRQESSCERNSLQRENERLVLSRRLQAETHPPVFLSEEYPAKYIETWGPATDFHLVPHYY